MHVLTLIHALESSELDLQQARHMHETATIDANQAWKLAQEPDATLRLMLTEALADLESLRVAHEMMKRELAELSAIVGE